MITFVDNSSQSFQSEKLDRLQRQLQQISKNINILTVLSKHNSLVSMAELAKATGITNRHTLLKRLDHLATHQLIRKVNGFARINKKEVDRVKQLLEPLDIHLPF